MPHYLPLAYCDIRSIVLNNIFAVICDTQNALYYSSLKNTIGKMKFEILPFVLYSTAKDFAWYVNFLP